MSLTATIERFVCDDQAERVLKKYYAGRYTGSLFDTAPDLVSPEPNRVTAHDIAAVATLSVPLGGASVASLLKLSDEIASHLAGIDDVDLDLAPDDLLARLYTAQSLFDGRARGIGHVTRSKLLAHKRPHLVPIRDRHVLGALVGSPRAAFTEPLRQALAGSDAIRHRLDELGRLEGVPRISRLRVLDVVIWMKEHGDAQVSD